MTSFKALCEELTAEIQESYEAGVTLEQAEKLAGKFLNAQIQVSDKLRQSDLDARMKRSGLKAVKAAVYLEGVKAQDKKPSDVLLSAQVDINKEVNAAQDLFDTAEAEHDALERYYNIFKESHIHFRGISKGRYD